MKEKILAKRYAEAYVGYSRNNLSVAKIVEEMKDFKTIIRNNPEIIGFVENPEITFSEKCAFIEVVLDGHFSQELRQFLKLLLSKRRIELMVEIIDYVRTHYSHAEAIDALIKTSYPLDLELIQKIENKLEKRFKRKLNFYLDLGASLLGGVQVTVGNTVIDGSVRRRLDELKAKLKTIRIS